MDKKKTGSLIREARAKKNYTQSELGNLLGVSNKAVSRWENGDSFPDVGVLENLASVLDLRIQDIVTGGVEMNGESAVTEVVRVVKLQWKEKIHNLIRNSVFILAMLCCIISGCLAFGNNGISFANDSAFMYMSLMVLSYVLMLVGCGLQIETDKNDTNKICKCMRVVSFVSFVWSIIVLWGVFFMVTNGQVPFGIELSSVGTFINAQLIGLFILNFAIFSWELYRYAKKDVASHWGWLISIAAMYMTVLYSDMLHRMSSVQEVMNALTIRTITVLATVGIALVAAKIIKAKANRNKIIHEDE